MANKLKNLKITSVDLCKQGANQDAHIRLYKSADAPETCAADKNAADGNPQDQAIDKSLLDGLCAGIAKVVQKAFKGGDCNTGGINGLYTNTGDMRENIDKDEVDSMKIDKSKMSAEERAQFEVFEKKYGAASENGETLQNENSAAEIGKAEDELGNPSNLHPDVAKALSDIETLKKSLSDKESEILEIRKSLEIEKLTVFAKRYEIIGKKAEALAPKLYELRKAGGTAYDDYVGLLNEQVTLVEKSGLFTEIGKNRLDDSTSTWGKVESAAQEIAVRDGISKAQAIDRLGIENPGLIAEYRKGML